MYELYQVKLDVMKTMNVSVHNHEFEDSLKCSTLPSQLKPAKKYR